MKVVTLNTLDKKVQEGNEMAIIIKRHIPGGCINLKGGYAGEISAIMKCMEDYASAKKVNTYIDKNRKKFF